MLKKISNIRKINWLKLLRLEQIEKPLIFLLALTLFFITNFLLSFVSLRWDLSSGKAYTLSSASKKILGKLDDLVTVKFFVSSDLPTRFIPVKTEAADFLNEYKKAGRGKVQVKILDPKKDQAAANQAREDGVPELQFSQLERDKYAVSAVYFGVSINYGDKKEIIPQISDLESLEYNLTAAIYKLTNKEVAKIAVIGRQDEFGRENDDLFSLKQVLRQQFNLDFINIDAESAVETIDKSYKSLLVFDDTQKQYEQKEIDKIDKYLQNKGTAVFFVDGVWVDQNLQGTEAKHNLFNLLKNWGIEVNKNLLLSASAEMVNFGNNQFQFFTPYPFWIKTNRFNPKLGYFSNINQVVFPWVSSLTLNKKNKIELNELIKTSNQSWEQTSNYTLNPQQISEPQPSDLKEFIVAGQAKKADGGQIVVFPCSRFILERFLSRTAGNLSLILNIINDLASGGALSGIRQRAVAFYPLPEIEENQKDMFKYTNILLLPGLFAVFGAVKLLKKH